MALLIITATGLVRGVGFQPKALRFQRDGATAGKIEQRRRGCRP
ncbi:MAG: hypothetical protein R2873_27445 [Caldilineaceae bacterium]